MSKAKSFAGKFGNHPWVVFILAVYGLGQMLANFTGAITDMNIPDFLILDGVSDWIGAITNVILVTIIYFVLKAFTKTRLELAGVSSKMEDELKKRDDELDTIFLLWGALSYRRLTDLNFKNHSFTDRKYRIETFSEFFMNHMEGFKEDFQADFHEDYPDMTRADLDSLFKKAFPFYREYPRILEEILKKP